MVPGLAIPFATANHRVAFGKTKKPFPLLCLCRARKTVIAHTRPQSLPSEHPSRPLSPLPDPATVCLSRRVTSCQLNPFAFRLRNIHASCHETHSHEQFNKRLISTLCSSLLNYFETDQVFLPEPEQTLAGVAYFTSRLSSKQSSRAVNMYSIPETHAPITSYAESIVNGYFKASSDSGAAG